MKQFSLVVCLGLFVILGVSSAYADNQGYVYQAASPEAAYADNQPAAPLNASHMRYDNTMLNKLGRGIANIGTFYLEVPAAEMRLTKEKNNPVYGATVGTLGGLVTAVLRVLTGVYDTVTCVIPPYDRPLMDPPYATDSFETAYANSTD